MSGLNHFLCNDFLHSLKQSAFVWDSFSHYMNNNNHIIIQQFLNKSANLKVLVFVFKLVFMISMLMKESLAIGLNLWKLQQTNWNNSLAYWTNLEKRYFKKFKDNKMCDYKSRSIQCGLWVSFSSSEDGWEMQWLRLNIFIQYKDD